MGQKIHHFEYKKQKYQIKNVGLGQLFIYSGWINGQLQYVIESTRQDAENTIKKLVDGE